MRSKESPWPAIATALTLGGMALCALTERWATEHEVDVHFGAGSQGGWVTASSKKLGPMGLEVTLGASPRNVFWGVYTSPPQHPTQVADTLVSVGRLGVMYNEDGEAEFTLWHAPQH